MRFIGVRFLQQVFGVTRLEKRINEQGEQILALTEQVRQLEQRACSLEGKVCLVVEGQVIMIDLAQPHSWQFPRGQARDSELLQRLTAVSQTLTPSLH